MTRGLIAALIEDMTHFGGLKQTDWFVFEMDEAYAPIFTENISPKLVVGLNVLRDQLDRYGEIDKTAALIQQAASKSTIFIYNQLDPLLGKAAKQLSTQGVNVSAFGVSEELGLHIANEQTLLGEKVTTSTSSTAVTLTQVTEVGDMQQLLVDTQDASYEFVVPVKGSHNALNAAAVAACLYALSPSEIANGLKALAAMPTPFGRGEKLHFGEKDITVALVKNPSGFMSNLETFVKQAKPEAVLFVVNDRLADGRDVSWLWDVNFIDMIDASTAISTSGVRAYDMALRLKQDNFIVNTTTNIVAAIQDLMKSDYTNIVIIPTYTALFEVRAALSKYGKVPRIW
jgi:UDP-N-acetylmuramyl tripeptide synthase